MFLPQLLVVLRSILKSSFYIICDVRMTMFEFNVPVASAKKIGETGRYGLAVIPDVPVAQLDRVAGYEPVGRPFESGRAHHF